MAGDFSMAKRLNDLMVEGYSYMYEENNPAGIKAVLELQNNCTANVRLPLVKINKDTQKELEKLMDLFE